MKRSLVPMILLPCLIVSCVAKEPKPTDVELKQACLRATLKAIDSEIERHQAWLKQGGNPKNISEYKKELARLNADKRKYQEMKPDDYVLPEKRILTGEYTGQIYNFEGQSRSGPFYHVIASANSLKNGKKYEFEFYSVYRRSYWNMPNYYVYVSRARK